MSQKMTGVILAAGKGSRIDPFNAHFPKPLLPIANKPIIEHHIDIFRSLGIQNIKIVVGHLMEKIITHFGNGSAFGVNIEYVEQQATLGIAHAVGQLSQVVRGTFLLVLGDIYYAPKQLGLMVHQFESQGGGAVLAVMREDNLEAMKKNFTVEQGENGLVRRVVEKPRNPVNNLKGCGIYLFGDEMFDAIRKTPRTALRDEYEITNSIQILCDDGYPVSVAEVVDWDCNITFARDLLDANVEYLKRQGLVNLIDSTADVHPDAKLESVVVGSGVKINVPAHIRNAVILPDTTVGRGHNIEEMIISKEEWHQC